MATTPPKDTAQKWLAFGAVVVVAVSVSFASSAFKNQIAQFCAGSAEDVACGVIRLH